MPGHPIHLAATSLALLVSTAAFAPPQAAGQTPQTSPGQVPSASQTNPAAATPPAQSAPTASTGAASNTDVRTGQSATQNTTQSAASQLAAGMTVKDNTGATIGQVSEVSTDSKSGTQYATIKMGSDSFRLQADRLGVADGAATVNLTQAQIQAQLHPPKKQ